MRSAPRSPTAAGGLSLLLTSDSSFLFHIAELETAARQQLPLVCVRFHKVAEEFGCHGEFVEKEDEISPVIKRAYASGRTAVVHVCIDPKANSEEMSNYSEFRTWYAEGTQ